MLLRCPDGHRSWFMRIVLFSFKTLRSINMFYYYRSQVTKNLNNVFTEKKNIIRLFNSNVFIDTINMLTINTNCMVKNHLKMAI